MFRFLSAFIVVIAWSVALAIPPPAPNADAAATIISNTFTDDGAGNFAYAYETSNKIKAEAKGHLKEITIENGTKSQNEVQEGSFSFVGTDGQTYEIKWIADENGDLK